MTKPRPLPFSWVEEWRSDPELAPGVRLVLYALAMYMDARGVAWPSVSTLAKDTGYTRRQVFKHLDTAFLAGWITIRTGHGPKVKGGRLNTYRACIPSGEPQFTTSEEEGRSGEIRDRSGEIIDTEVVNSSSTECSVKAHRTLTTHLCDESHRCTRDEFLTAIEGGVFSLTGTAGIDHFTIGEARWLLEGLAKAKAEGVVATGNETTEEVVASVLYDINRKGWPWSRKRFVGFVESALNIRSYDGYAGMTWYVQDAWPVEPDEPDPAPDDFIDRAFASKLAAHRGRR